MNQFEEEIKRRIKHYYDQLAALENAYYNHEIESKEYVVEYEKIKGKIKLLKGSTSNLEYASQNALPFT